MSFLGSIAKAASAQVLGRGARSLARGVAQNIGNIGKGISRGSTQIFKGVGGPKIFKGAKALGRQARALPSIVKQRLSGNAGFEFPAKRVIQPTAKAVSSKAKFLGQKLGKTVKDAGNATAPLPRAVKQVVKKPPMGFVGTLKTIGRDLQGARLIGAGKAAAGKGGKANTNLLRNLRANYAESATGGRFGGFSKVLRNIGRFGNQGADLATETAIDQLVGRGIMGLGGAALGTGGVVGGTVLGNKISGKRN